MRRGHVLIVGIALAGAAVAFFGSDRDRLVHTTSPIVVREATVRADLERIEQQAALGNFAVDSRHVVGLQEAPDLSVELESGCAILAVGGWGALSVDMVATAPSGGTHYPSGRGPHLRMHAPLTQHIEVCHSSVRMGTLAAEPEYVNVLLHTEARDGVSEPAARGELIVLLGNGRAPPIVAGRLVPIEERVVVREAVLAGAATNATVVFFLLALLGLMAHVALSRGKVSQDGESSLRRLSIALPSEHRSALDPLVQAAHRGELAEVKALRDRLATMGVEIHAAAWESERAATRRINLRLPKRVEALRQRGAATAADYRSREAGSVVLTLVVQHECELPDFPAVVRRAGLAELLAGLLPADPRQLDTARVWFCPVDPSQTLSDEALTDAFPELVRFEEARTARSA